MYLLIAFKELIEDVKVPLAFDLMHNARLLQQVLLNNAAAGVAAAVKYNVCGGKKKLSGLERV